MISCFLALGLGAIGPVRAQDPRAEAEVSELRKRFHELERQNTFGSLQPKQLDLLREVARIRDLHAAKFLVEVARDTRYSGLRGEIIGLLAKPGMEDAGTDASFVKELFEEQMAPDDPYRPAARKGLLWRAIRTKDDAWLRAFFASRVLEDRFLALEGMGLIGLTSTLHYAQQLLDDPEWSPVEGTKINCGTIGRALTDLESPEAARLLLLLRRDPRFTVADGHELREATRLWKRKDLLDYVEVSVLAAPDPGARITSARFMGRARIEAARNPLLVIARNRAENADVRAAAAEALGGLTIAKGDLARNLAKLLEDSNEIVQEGAIRGLARLRVRQAVEILAGLMGGPLEDEARAALAGVAGQPADSDWKKWASGSDCPFPEGT